ncbi:MAG: class I SAM-dependent methyltransferase [candidate division Zixibacteria bacterium]|nr:class I SAM-dependent methyltransferase [candidate division Zixibacteria bacterium]
MAKRYDEKAAGRFWTRRLKDTDPLSAVLTFDAPKSLNKAYDTWERQSLLSLLESSLTEEKALDLGCGTGRIALTLAARGAEVTALDVSEGMLAYVAKQARRQRVSSRVKCVPASSTAVPASDGTFDIVTCFGLLEHLPEAARRKTLLEAFRVLKRAGRLFAVINNTECVFLQRQYGLREQREDGYFVSLVGLEWLEAVAGRGRMRVWVRAANPFYALAHYYLYPHRELLFKSARDFERQCELAARCDLLGEFEKTFRDRVASHFLVEIRHGRSKKRR